jgi:hypothetical protein
VKDTDPKIAKLVRQRLMERSGAERVMMASDMFETAKAMVLASLPTGLTEIEIKGLLVERIYGDEVDARAFVEHLKTCQKPCKSSEFDHLGPDLSDTKTPHLDPFKPVILPSPDDLPGGCLEAPSPHSRLSCPV